MVVKPEDLTDETKLKRARQLSEEMLAYVTAGDEQALAKTMVKLSKLLEEAPMAAKALTVSDKGIFAWEMQKAGHGVADISRALGYTDEKGAMRALDRYYEEYLSFNRDTVDRQQMLVHARYEALLQAIWAKAMWGNLEAVRAIDLLQKSVRQLLGLDAPVKALVGRFDIESGEVITGLVLPDKDVIDVDAREPKD